MEKPIHVFMSCGITQGSFWEVLFHQLTDGAVPKMATDRQFSVAERKVRVSLTTDSGVLQYPSRLNDLYRQADVIIMVYNITDRKTFEELQERIDYILGGIRDFAPASFLLLGILPAGFENQPFAASPQEIQVLSSQPGVSFFELDLTKPKNNVDELWIAAAKAHLILNKNSPTSSSSAHLPLKEDVLLSLATSLVTRKESSEELTGSLTTMPAKKVEKLFKSVLKSIGKKESISVQPCKYESKNIPLLTQYHASFTLTNNTKNPISWSIPQSDDICPQFFFSCYESSGTIQKGKSVTISTCSVFFAPATISKILLVETPQDPGISTPFMITLNAPLQAREPNAYWKIDPKNFSTGFRISQSSCANVFRGTLFGAVVAMKVWNPGPHGQPLPDFLSEWEAFVKIKHPNIAQFLGGRMEQENHFIVLEYLKYGALGTFLQQPAPRGVVKTFDMRLKMATDLAKAMAYLHSQKMFHRDLTSANVLVDSDCSVKLADFGESRPPSSFQNNDPGAYDWTAPEVLTGNFTAKSDIFSFGVILWELAAERPPTRTLSDVQSGAIPPMPMEIRMRYPDYITLVQKCTNSDPHIRPTFDEIVADLESIRKVGPVAISATPVAYIKTPRTESPRAESPAAAVLTPRVNANRAAPPPMLQPSTSASQLPIFPLPDISSPNIEPNPPLSPVEPRSPRSTQIPKPAIIPNAIPPPPMTLSHSSAPTTLNLNTPAATFANNSDLVTGNFTCGDSSPKVQISQIPHDPITSITGAALPPPVILAPPNALIPPKLNPSFPVSPAITALSPALLLVPMILPPLNTSTTPESSKLDTSNSTPNPVVAANFKLELDANGNPLDNPFSDI